MSILNRKLTLKLNANWQITGVCTVQKALVAMNSQGYGDEEAPAVALDLEYPRLNIDSNDFKDWYNWLDPLKLEPLKWEQWIKRPIRDFDIAIHTPKMTIRVPTVLIDVNFKKMPMKKRRPTSAGIWERDNSTCQISGERVTKSTGNIEHLLPVSRGGSDTWENMVLCKKEINSKKGNKTVEEFGLKLIRQPKAPKSIPLSHTINYENRPEWRYFLCNR